MSQPMINMTLLFVLAAMYLPVVILVSRQHEGQENTATLLSVYALTAMLVGVGHGLVIGGQWQLDPQTANDSMIYAAFVLAVIMNLTALSFTKRDYSTWLGIGVFWALVIAVVATNILGLGEVIWTDGRVTLTRDRLGPALAALGWFVFTVGALVNVRSAHARSRQPLLRNRLNYWTPVFLLVFINDILLIAGRQIPGDPFRLIAAAMAAFIIVTHDPPDLRQVARRVFTYMITTIVIVGIYIAAFS
ncbi:MAG TPA: hypothetical protein VK851_08815, partial [Anaerolineales bacterium]|nr:hypothetical protein [Anaerolineales bacterium]